MMRCPARKTRLGGRRVTVIVPVLTMTSSPLAPATALTCGLAVSGRADGHGTAVVDLVVAVAPRMRCWRPRADRTMTLVIVVLSSGGMVALRSGAARHGNCTAIAPRLLTESLPPRPRCRCLESALSFNRRAKRNRFPADTSRRRGRRLTVNGRGVVDDRVVPSRRLLRWWTVGFRG
jgi:hypothetical protein